MGIDGMLKSAHDTRNETRLNANLLKQCPHGQSEVNGKGKLFCVLIKDDKMYFFGIT